MTRRGSVVANSHVPQLDVVVERDEDGLLGVQVLVIASEFGIREAVTALVAGVVETLAHRLPGVQIIAGARRSGLDATTEMYPYTAGMTDIGSAVFDEGWEGEQGGIGFGGL